MQDNRFMNPSAAQAASMDVGLRSYMLGVYNHMTTALAFTGFAAFATKWAVLSVPGVGQTLFGSPLAYVIMFAPLAMVFWLSATINCCTGILYHSRCLCRSINLWLHNKA